MKKIYLLFIGLAMTQQGVSQFCDNTTSFLNIGGKAPAGVIAKDLDGDGNIDIITGINSAAEVIINYGNGNGTFGADVILPVFSLVYDWSGIKAVDFNNDNILDIVCNSHTSNKCSIILSTGARTYAPFTTVNTPTYPLGVVAHDFNGDGNQDFSTANYAANSVSIFLGNGAGLFSAPLTYPSLAIPYDMSGGDFNNDGNLDLVASCGSALCIFPGNGDGTFGTRIDLTGAGGSTVTNGDYNNDGNLDISVSIGGSLGILLGNGNLTFGSLTTYTGSKNPYHMTAADFDNDGDIDVMGGASDAYVILFFNDGLGTFSNSSIWSSASYGIGTAAADFNEDGRTDFVNAGYVSQNLAVHLATALPCDRNVTASPTNVCAGSSSSITVANSQFGIQYTLRDNATNNVISGPTTGTGSNLNFNTGNLTNTTTFNVLASSVVTSGALNFDGSDDNVAMPTIAAISDLAKFGNKFSVEAWVNPTTASGVLSIIRKESDYVFCIFNGKVYLEAYHTGCTMTRRESALSVPINQWTHVAGVWDGTNITLYVNGVASNGAQSTSAACTTSGLFIGKSGVYNEHFSGSIDEARIWNDERTALEVSGNLTTTLVGNEQGLVAYYTFENGTGSSTLTDLTSNGNNGTLTTMDPATDWISRTSVTSMVLTTLPTVTVNPLPTITVNSGSICAGQSFTMVPSGADTYTYSNGSSVATPSANASYTVIGTSSLTGCSNAEISSVTVNALPVITTQPASITVCGNATGTFTVIATNGNTYSWGWSSNNIGFTTTTGVYGETGYTTSILTMPNLQSLGWGGYYIRSVVTSSNGCSVNSTSGFITVNTLPSITVNSGSICAGQSFTMVPSGADTYTYSNGSSVVTPSANATYSVSGTNTLTGCVSNVDAESNITVNALPVVSVSSGSICAGQSYTIIANGASTYTSVPSIAGPVVTPTATTDYSITGTDANGCVTANTVVSSVTVNVLPTISVNSATICAGQSFTMVPTGAATFTYSNGSSVATPTANATYSVSGTDANGCVSNVDAVSSITVNALPTISVNSGTICAGQSFTMVPSGADTYTYSNGSSVATPSANATYSVSGTSTLTGCVSNVDAESIITVNALPTVVAVTNNTLLCTGETVTLTASGTATTYTWSTTENTTAIAVTPTVQTTYTVDGTDANGCVNSTTVTQDVSLCTGIVTLSNSNASVNVYPNPNNGLFVLELTTVAKVTVTNALGQVVISEIVEAGKHNLDIQNEATGVYFVKVIENNKQQTIKVIKQ